MGKGKVCTRSGFDSDQPDQRARRMTAGRVLKMAGQWLLDLTLLCFYMLPKTPLFSAWTASLLVARAMLYTLQTILLYGLIQSVLGQGTGQESNALVEVIETTVHGLGGTTHTRTKRFADFTLTALDTAVADQIINDVAAGLNQYDSTTTSSVSTRFATTPSFSTTTSSASTRSATTPSSATTTFSTTTSSGTTPPPLANPTAVQHKASLVDVLKVWFYIMFGLGLFLFGLVAIVIQCLVDLRLTPARTPTCADTRFEQ